MSTVRRRMPALVRDDSPGQRAYRALRDWIAEGRLLRGERLPAERKLARLLGVSQKTVRSALARLSSEQLILRNASAARARHSVKAHATVAASAISHSLLLLTTTQDAAQWQNLPGRMEQIELSVMAAAERAGFSVLRMAPQQCEGEACERILRERPAGVLAMHCVGEYWWSPQTAARFKRHRLPTVFIGDFPSLQRQDRVVFDHQTGARQLTGWLLAAGHRRILRVWDVAETYYWLKARSRGYAQALEEARLKPLPVLELPVLNEAGPLGRVPVAERVRLAADALAPMLRGPSAVDTLMAISDPSAFLLAAACRRLGREPNRDVWIVGYDNLGLQPELLGFQNTGLLATVDKRTDQAGTQMVQMLLARMAGTLPPVPQKVLVEPRLVVFEREGEKAMGRFQMEGRT